MGHSRSDAPQSLVDPLNFDNLSVLSDPVKKTAEGTARPDGLRLWEGPAIILMDLDAFFASVEQLDHPAWRGKPVIVGGSPDKRGVVSTASYEARRYGVHSAMPSAMAARLCPDAIWTPGNFHRYREMSKAVMEILYDESPHLMQVSIDEAFLDVSPTRANRTHPFVVAQRIQSRVDELGITCSIGVGRSKSVAKIASDQNKPHGITLVYPDETEAFLAPLPIGVMSGVGAVAQRRLHDFHIRTLGELAHADTAILKRIFGVNAALMADRAHGIDTPVADGKQPAKSISNEISFSTSISETRELRGRIATMAHKVGRRLRAKGLEGKTLHLKIRRDDLGVRTCQRKVEDLGTNELTWIPLLYEMLDEIHEEGEALRLVGVGVSGFEEESVQESLFSLDGFDEPSDPDSPKSASPLLSNARKNAGLLEANDRIAQRFGEGAVRFGHEIKTYGQTTGTAPKNPEDYR